MNAKLMQWMKINDKGTIHFQKSLGKVFLNGKCKTVRLSSIKIKDDFSTHMPKSNKLAAKYDYTKNQLRINRKYNDNRKLFQSLIILDKKNNLLDEYTSYLIAKMLGIKKVEVIIRENNYR